MGFLDNITGRISSIFSGDNDELLFFIVVFLFLFGTTPQQDTVCDNADAGNGGILFFILLFLLLLFNADRSEEVC